jgi:hypothetical protein
MSLIEMGLPRRQKSSHDYRPRIDVLESRECLSVAAPTGLQLAALSPSQVKVTWNDVANETGYRIYQWNGTQSVLKATLAANTTSFTASGLTPNQTQWFIVQAFNATASAYTAWASIKTPADALTTPTNLKIASTTLTTMTLTWGDATGETGYRIFGWNGTSAVQIGSVGANVTAFQVQNLSPGQNYYFYVQSFNNTNTAHTDWISGSTQAIQLTAPTNLTAQVVSSNTLALAWKDGGAEVGYRVYRWDGNNAVSPVVIATLPANSTAYQATGLLPGKTYWFYVQAFNSSNSVANSTWASATTTPVAVLQAPSQVTLAYAGWNSVRVSWAEASQAVGYRVFIWTGYGWAPVTAVAAGTTSVRIDGLFTNRTHWFMVQSFTANFAEVAYSNAVFINL